MCVRVFTRILFLCAQGLWRSGNGDGDDGKTIISCVKNILQVWKLSGTLATAVEMMVKQVFPCKKYFAGVEALWDSGDSGGDVSRTHTPSVQVV